MIKNAAYYLEDLSRLSEISMKELVEWENKEPYYQPLKYLIQKKNEMLGLPSHDSRVGTSAHSFGELIDISTDTYKTQDELTPDNTEIVETVHSSQMDGILEVANQEAKVGIGATLDENGDEKNLTHTYSADTYISETEKIKDLGQVVNQEASKTDEEASRIDMYAGVDETQKANIYTARVGEITSKKSMDEHTDEVKKATADEKLDDMKKSTHIDMYTAEDNTQKYEDVDNSPFKTVKDTEKTSMAAANLDMYVSPSNEESVKLDAEVLDMYAPKDDGSKSCGCDNDDTTCNVATESTRVVENVAHIESIDMYITPSSKEDTDATTPKKSSKSKSETTESTTKKGSKKQEKKKKSETKKALESKDRKKLIRKKKEKKEACQKKNRASKEILIETDVDFLSWLKSKSPESKANMKSSKKNKKDKKAKKRKSKETQIIKAANKSTYRDTTVISETLATILAKQGHKKEAIEMYKQLSLLITEKSTYFAAKIKELKKS